MLYDSPTSCELHPVAWDTGTSNSRVTESLQFFCHGMLETIGCQACVATGRLLQAMFRLPTILVVYILCMALELAMISYFTGMKWPIAFYTARSPMQHPVTDCGSAC